MDDLPAPFDGFLLEYCCPTPLGWRPDRFISVALTVEDALAAVAHYVGRQIEVRVIEQGATVLSRARELGVGDGKVLGLI